MKMDKETKAMLEKINQFSKSHNVEVYQHMPPDYSVLPGASTAPVGSVWISNKESYFGYKRKNALLLESWLLDKICCNICILYQFCTYDRTGICEAENSKNEIPAKCRFCELRWVCPVDRGGECVRDNMEGL